MNHDDEDKNHISMAQAVKNMRENLISILEYNKLNAKVIRAKYLALLENGFTEEQAIQLCK